MLQNSSWSDHPFTQPETLNLTGLNPDQHFAWRPLALAVRDRAQVHLRYGHGAQGLLACSEAACPMPDEPYHYYANITGTVHGRWKRSIAQSEIAPALNLSSYTPDGPFGVLQAREFDRNITSKAGDVRVRFHQTDTWDDGGTVGAESHNVTKLRADVTISDPLASEEHELQLYGVYNEVLGQALLTTTSPKFAGIYILPHLAVNGDAFDETKRLMNQTISKVIDYQERGLVGLTNPWTSRTDGTQDTRYAMPQCELVMYLQQLTAYESGYRDTNDRNSLSAKWPLMEQELRFPSGAYVPTAPTMRFTMLAYSPDCGYVLESQGKTHIDEYEQGTHLTGPKLEVQYNSARYHSLFFMSTIGLQVALLMRQMREASTPSTRSRISYFTIAMLALGDGYATMAFLLVSLFLPTLWVNLVAMAFVAFVSVSFFGMRFLLDLWTVQAPERAVVARAELEEERARRERLIAALDQIRTERAARLARLTTPVDPSGDTPAVVTTDEAATIINGIAAVLPPVPVDLTPPQTLPLPVTAPRPIDTGATPVFMPSDQLDLEQITQGGLLAPPGEVTEAAVAARGGSFASLYTRFYLVLLGTLFLSTTALPWPSGPRRVFFTSLAFVYLSFWIPQIVRNVQRNCRHALNWEFVLGQSSLRLVPFVYFWVYPDNVLFSNRNYTAVMILVLWLGAQILTLASQELIGPRWFIKNDWAPEAYDYHPVLREDEEGATLPLGLSDSGSAPVPGSPISERRRSSVSSPIARRASMVKEAKREKGKRLYDCAICFQELEVPVIETDGSSEGSTTLAGGILARRLYMVTPCRHIFHSACLEGWMKYRLQCPICRETLPPL